MTTRSKLSRPKESYILGVAAMINEGQRIKNARDGPGWQSRPGFDGGVDGRQEFDLGDEHVAEGIFKELVPAGSGLPVRLSPELTVRPSRPGPERCGDSLPNQNPSPSPSRALIRAQLIVMCYYKQFESSLRFGALVGWLNHSELSQNLPHTVTGSHDEAPGS